MGAPDSGMQAAEQPSAEALLSAFKTIDPSERRRHASLLNYWLSIRGDREFPPLHDLDPLEISDAGPSSLLLELISGGHDAEIRHCGEALKAHVTAERIIDASSPSVLASIAKKLPIVAISRDFLAFEDKFSGPEGETRCWVTLLPLSAEGAWVDYVYALVTLDGDAVEPAAAVEASPEAVEPEAAAAEQIEEPAADVSEEKAESLDAPADDPVEPIEAVAEVPEAEIEAVEAAPDYGEPESPEGPGGKPGFSKLFDSLAGLTGFYGHGFKTEPLLPDEPPADQPACEDEVPCEPVPVEEPAADETVEDAPAAEEAAAEPVVEEAVAETVTEEPVVEDAVAETVTEEPVVEEAVDEQIHAEEPVDDQPVVEEPVAEQHASEIADNPAPASEGSLQTKLSEVRAKADEARAAKLRANAALYDGLSAAYDFALDAEEAPEEYLRLVEAQGLKIQLRSPMRPVVKLAFDGLCDDSTIAQLEAVLAWALKEELPRGALAEKIQEAGGIAGVLNGGAQPA